MRILVVENSRRMREAMKLALDSFGQVIMSGSATEAKAVFAQAEPIDIVFTDFHMRGGSGLEVVDYVNQYHPGLPVVVITAYGTKELTIDCLNRQVFRFLEKPVNYDDLKTVMTEAMSMREKSLSEKRVRELGILSNLIFHEIGGGLQDLLNETQSVDLSSVESESAPALVGRFQQVRNNIYETANAFRNLKFLIHEDRLNLNDIEEVDLTDALQKMSGWLVNWTDTYEIAVEFDVPQEPVKVGALPGLVERAVKNLLINAVEALSAYEGQRKIRVVCRRDEAGEAVLSVFNNGPAIPQEIQEKIFEFSFSMKSLGGVPRGIGLYVVDRVMKSIGGRVEVDSTTEWTAFTLHFSQ